MTSIYTSFKRIQSDYTTFSGLQASHSHNFSKEFLESLVFPKWCQKQLSLVFFQSRLGSHCISPVVELVVNHALTTGKCSEDPFAPEWVHPPNGRTCIGW